MDINQARREFEPVMKLVFALCVVSGVLDIAEKELDEHQRDHVGSLMLLQMRVKLREWLDQYPEPLQEEIAIQARANYDKVKKHVKESVN